MGWTREQEKAINARNANILVSAGAGSGKTSVLVERIIKKLINDHINIEDILVVTFTEAAASEMKERVLKALYKEFCSPKIRQGIIPKTLAEFLDEEE